MRSAVLTILLLALCPWSCRSAASGAATANALTIVEAEKNARRALSALDSGHEIVLQDKLTVERDFGWVFFPISRRYLETNNPGDLVPGLGPIAVDRTTGAVARLASSVPPKRAIDQYEEEWRKTVDAK